MSRDKRPLCADFSPFFPLGLQRVHRHWATCPAVLSIGGCICNMAAPHTSCGSRAVCTTLAESAACGLCDLETSLGPRPVLCQRQDARQTCSREVPARGRSRPRPPWATRAGCAGAGVGLEANGERRARARSAQRRAATQSCVPGSAWRGRGIPGGSREASRGPTPRPALCTHWGLAQAGWGCHMSDTARAHGGAQMVHALPFRGVVSPLVRPV